MVSGPGGDARANALSRLATSSVGAEPAAWPLLWRRRRNHGSWPISAGKVRVKGRRQGNVCGPHEVHLVTTARSEPLVGTPQGVDNQATAPTSPNPSQRYSRVAPLPSRSGQRPPPVDPQVILYVGKWMPRS